MKEPKKIQAFKEEAVVARVQEMERMKHDIIRNVSDYHVQISPGNRKTGIAVSSISLIPIACCPNCEHCKNLCYDVRNDCMYKETKKARARNTAIWEISPHRYFEEISAAAKFTRYFRWHIGGDIVNMTYLLGMVDVANENKHCTFLAFTKNYKVVNDYLKAFELPCNLKIIFSRWPGTPCDNPNHLPEAHVIFAEGTTTANEETKPCSGNCSECAVTDSGCWTLKSGESVSFPAH